MQRLLAAVFLCLCFFMPVLGINVTEETGAVTLAQNFLKTGTGITITSAFITGQPYINKSSGVYNSGPMGINNGIILSTGAVYMADASYAYPSNDVGLPGNIILETQVGGGVVSNDAIELTLVFDADSGVNSVYFDFIYASEEYPAYVGSSYNDSIIAMLNGQQVMYDASGNMLTINGPFFSGGNVIITPSNGLSYGGSTGLLTTMAPVVPGSTGNVLRIIIADITDSLLDSAVLLSSFRGNAQIITTPITGYSTPESTPTVSPSMIGTPTITPTHTVSPTITGTNTPFISPTFTITQTCTPSPTVTPTCTPVSAVVEVLLEVIDYAVRSGETARVRINVRNSGKDPAVNAVLWDSIPSGASLESGSSDNASWAFSSGVITRNIGTIMPGESRTYYYLLRADTGLPEQYIIAVPEANCAFNDMLSPAVPKISISLPGTIAILGQIHIYPNPFNPRTANGGKLKITGAPRDTKITIYSVSGELVISFFADASIVLWDGKNRYGKTVSPGVYFYHISWDSDKQYVKGKIFITSFE